METLVDIGLRNAAMAVPFALVALAAGRWAKRPALTHALWMLVLAPLLLPPLWHVTVPRPAFSAAAVAEAPPVGSEIDQPETSLVNTAPIEAAGPMAEATGAAEPIGFELPAEPQPVAVVTPAPLPPVEPKAAWLLPPWQTVVSGIWLAGSCLILLVSLVRVARFQWALRRAKVAPPSIQYQAGRIARQLGLSRSPAVWLVNGCVSPLLWGIVRPRLILPESLWSALDAGRRDALLAHELAHYARGDHWVRGLELIAGVLFWWHPLVWAARVKLREAEEQCCDAWVVWALPDGRRAYATALVDTVDFLSEGRSVLPALASGVGRVRHLKGRLTMIMRGTTPRRLPRLALMGLLSAGLALGTLGVSWAQDRPEPPPPRDRPSEPPREHKPDPAPRARTPDGDPDQAIREELRRARDDFERARRRLEELERRLSGRRDDTGGGPPGRTGDTPRGGPAGPGGDPRGRDTRPVPPGPDLGGPGGGPGVGGPGGVGPRGIGGPGGGPGVGPAAGGPGGLPGMPGRGPDNRGGNMEERMQNIERMMQQIMQRLEQMDRGSRGNPTPNRGGGGRPGAPGDGGRPGGPGGGNGVPGTPGGPPPRDRDNDGGRQAR